MTNYVNPTTRIGGVEQVVVPEREASRETSVADLSGGIIAPGVEIIAGDPVGNHASFSDSGFRVFAEDLDDGVPNEVIRMGTDSGDLFSITDSMQQVKASISGSGGGAFTGLSVDPTELNPDGSPAKGLSIYGTEFLEWLDTLPRGVCSWEVFASDVTSLDSNEYGYGEIGFVARPGRLYRISMRGAIETNDTGGIPRVNLRMSYANAPNDAPSPTVTSPLLLQHRPNWESDANEEYSFSDFAMLYNESLVDRNVRVLMTIWSDGVGTATLYAPGGGAANFSNPEAGAVIVAEDVGPYLSQGGAYNTGGATVTPRKQYVSTWNATNSESYRGDNTARTDAADLVQGYNSFNGDGFGVVVFGGNAATGETTKTIGAALSGATIRKVEVYLYANHWYYSSGGTALIRAYNSTSLSSSTPSGTIKQSASWPKPGGRWVDITSIATAAIRGITVGKAGSTNLLYYGRFNGHTQSNKPKLRITYVR